MSETTVQSFRGTGRRKTAVAQVRLLPGSGKITVNGRAFEVYFPMETHRTDATRPLTVTSNAEKYDIHVTLRGGGPTGQSEAMRLGISRALLKIDIAMRPALKKEGFLTRDPRMKERKKYGQPGARKRFQFSKR